MENIKPTHTDKTSRVKKLNFPKEYAGGRDVTSERTAVALAWPSTICVIEANVGRYYWAGKSPGRMLSWL